MRHGAQRTSAMLLLPFFPHVLCPAAVATPHCSRSAWEMPCRRSLSGLQHMAVLQCLGKMKRILDRLRKGAIYVDDSVVKRDTLRTLDYRWTACETATYQRRRSEEYYRRCIPVALGERGVGAECHPGASRTPGTAVRRAGLVLAGGAGVQTGPGSAAPQTV